MALVKPNDTNRWDTNNLNVVQPDDPHRDDGWEAEENPPAEFFNFIQKLQGEWNAWLDERIADSVLPSVGSVLFRAPAGTDGAGVRIRSEDSALNPLGGGVDIRTGTGTTTGGSISIVPQDVADVPGPDFTGGDVIIRGGDSGSNSGDGGIVTLLGGTNNAGTGAGGEAIIGGGLGFFGGNLSLIGGDSNDPTNGPGGNVIITGGASVGPSDSGSINLTTQGADNRCGDILLTGGDSSLAGPSSIGGKIQLQAGEGDKEPGSVSISAGNKLDGPGGSVGGAVSLAAGNTPSGTGGSVFIDAGGPVSPTGPVVGGNVDIRAGNADGTDQLGGDVKIQSGRSTGNRTSHTVFSSPDFVPGSGSTLNIIGERFRVGPFGSELFPGAQYNLARNTAGGEEENGSVVAYFRTILSFGANEVVEIVTDFVVSPATGVANDKVIGVSVLSTVGLAVIPIAISGVATVQNTGTVAIGAGRWVESNGNGVQLGGGASGNGDKSLTTFAVALEVINPSSFGQILIKG